jgi:hypothetical protein
MQRSFEEKSAMTVGSMAERASQTILPDVAVPNGRVLLRWEALALLGACLALYGHFGFGWGAFALLFFLPDLSMLGYLHGARAGAIAYNAAHSEIGPALLGAIALLAPSPAIGAIALIWMAHVAFDRALGYGLKSLAGFRHTHLGTIGFPR